MLKILPAGVEIFSANIVHVKDPELPSSNRIGRFGVGMSQNTEEAGKKEERRKYANGKSPLYWFYEPGEMGKQCALSATRKYFGKGYHTRVGGRGPIEIKSSKLILQ